MPRRAANVPLVGMNDATLKAQSHCVYSTHFHLVLVTRNGRKLLSPRVVKRLETLARERVEAWKGELLDLQAAPDHVRLHVELPPTVAVAEFANALKTGTSRRLRSEFASLRAHKQLWSQSYCVVSGESPPPGAIADYLARQGVSPGVEEPTGQREPAALSTDALQGLSESASDFVRQHDREAKLAITAALEAVASQYEGAGPEERARRAPKRAGRRPQGERLTVAQAAQRAGVSRPTIYNWINDGSLIAWKADGRGLEIPTEQIDEEGRLVPGIRAVVAAIGEPREAWHFLATPRSLGGKRVRPIDALKSGAVEAVADAASRLGTPAPVPAAAEG